MLTPLRCSCSDPIASVSLLCDVEGVLIDNPDASGWTPLALAAQQGAVMSSLCLLNHGANIDAADKLVRHHHHRRHHHVMWTR